jgi:hypothetical protein
MTRRNRPADPTAEHTADQSTPSAGGLTGGRPEAPREDLVNRNPEARPSTPRRYDEEAEDPALPADDSSLRTEI